MTRGESSLGARLVLGLATCVGLAACSGHGGSVPKPPDSATPEQVVAAYTTALVQGDCATADVLFSGRDAQAHPCPDDDLVKTTPGEVSRLDAKVWGKKPTDEVVDVMVTRSRREGGFLGIGRSVVDSPWSYRLERASSSQPWRIVSEGLG